MPDVIKEAPEIVKEVQAEIKKLGEGFEADKKNYTELRKDFEAFKIAVDELDGKNKGEYDTLIDNKLVKLSLSNAKTVFCQDNNLVTIDCPQARIMNCAHNKVIVMNVHHRAKITLLNLAFLSYSLFFVI